MQVTTCGERRRNHQTKFPIRFHIGGTGRGHNYNHLHHYKKIIDQLPPVWAPPSSLFPVPHNHTTLSLLSLSSFLPLSLPSSNIITVITITTIATVIIIPLTLTLSFPEWVLFTEKRRGGIGIYSKEGAGNVGAHAQLPDMRRNRFAW